MTDLLLKRATASPGEVYNVMCEERIVGRIMLSADAQFPWVWTLTYGYHEDRTPTHATSQPARQPCRRSPRAGTGRRDARWPAARVFLVGPPGPSQLKSEEFCTHVWAEGLGGNRPRCPQ